MAGYTALADGATGLVQRGKINTQFNELFTENGKACITVADAAALAAIPAEYLTSGKLVLQEDTGDLWQWDGAAFITPTIFIGEDTIAEFPHPRLVVANGDTGHTYPGILGISGAAKSDGAHTSTGVGGNASTSGAQNGRGVVGVGKVTAGADTGDSIGVFGRAVDAHAGGNNIAILGNAQNGANNYSFYGSNGEMHNEDDITAGGDIVADGKIQGATASIGALAGILKGTAGAVGTATAKTDYAPATVGTAILKGAGDGGFADAVADTDYAAASPKARFSAEGGLLVKAVAGENLSKGEVVSVLQAPSGATGKVYKTPTTAPSNDMPLGVVYANALQDADVWIVVSGIAEILPQAADTAARGYVLTASTSTAGRVAQASSAPAAATHFKEVGHWLDDGAGAGLITRAIIHFN